VDAWDGEMPLLDALRNHLGLAAAALPGLTWVNLGPSHADLALAQTGGLLAAPSWEPEARRIGRASIDDLLATVAERSTA
jgi:hypothetical protein